MSWLSRVTSADLARAHLTGANLTRARGLPWRYTWPRVFWP